LLVEIDVISAVNYGPIKRFDETTSQPMERQGSSQEASMENAMDRRLEETLSLPSLVA
jgi:hypothetical protein